jgi:alkanesulfonate monooxygenase SsuD/methylene tetrahydromethanopterin reductase-like flavin-dependent oxidoreductase (luciferase family)
MKVGVSLFTQNHSDWERVSRGAFDEPPAVSDQQIYDEELALAEQIEGLGFDSIWAVEHHFSPLNLTPSPLQFLAFLAGRTRRVEIGTMVIVLPWHDPLRVAEELSMLDNMLQGRALHIGLGRGAARREFEPRGIPMGESRQRFLESLEIIRRAFREERFSFEGEHYTVNETTLRPRPRHPDLVDRMLVAGASPETVPLTAELGLGMLILNHKPWPEYREDVEGYNAIRRQHGWEPQQPIVVVNAYCTEDDEQGWQGLLRHFGEMKDGTNRHYEWDDPTHFREAGGYEHYARLGERRLERGERNFIEESSSTQVFGSPDRCYEQLMHIQEMTSAREFIIVFKYGNMPFEAAERSMRLFAEGVLPRLHAFEATLHGAAV